jgi:hypothetical protein
LALWNLDRAVALTPDDWTLYAARASVTYLVGQRDRATADLDEMIRRGANDAATAPQVAELAGAAGDWKRATQLLTTVAKVTLLVGHRLSEVRRHRGLPLSVRRYQQTAQSHRAESRAHRSAVRGDGIRAACERH